MGLSGALERKLEAHVRLQLLPREEVDQPLDEVADALRLAAEGAVDRRDGEALPREDREEPEGGVRAQERDAGARAARRDRRQPEDDERAAAADEAARAPETSPNETPARRTRSRTSCRAGGGTVHSRSFKTSGPPAAVTSTLSLVIIDMRHR